PDSSFSLPLRFTTSVSSLKSSIVGTSHRRRPPTNPLVVHCIHRSYDSVNFPAGVVSSRSDSQSSCAILSSKVVGQEQPPESRSGGENGLAAADSISSVNGHKTIDLDLVPIDKAALDLV
ncbi:unnamed protein product, partial [Linum tenue]